MLYYLEFCDSTQNYLKNKIQEQGYQKQLVFTYNQTNGIGSRGNTWIGHQGNLFFSFCIKVDELPQDLAIQSASIYFSYLLKEILVRKNSKVWVKWPNDFYINMDKVGGTITTLTSDYLICGIGLNLHLSEEFIGLDIDIDGEELLNDYIFSLNNLISWKEVFIKYQIEFRKNRDFVFHYENEQLSMNDAILLSDGSIEINNKRVYSLR